jgi:hypothetical protein
MESYSRTIKCTIRGAVQPLYANIIPAALLRIAAEISLVTSDGWLALAMHLERNPTGKQSSLTYTIHSPNPYLYKLAGADGLDIDFSGNCQSFFTHLLKYVSDWQPRQAAFGGADQAPHPWAALVPAYIPQLQVGFNPIGQQHHQIRQVAQRGLYETVNNHYKPCFMDNFGECV